MGCRQIEPCALPCCAWVGARRYTYANGVAMLAFVPSYLFIIPFTVYVAIPFFAREELHLTTSYAHTPTLAAGYCCCW